MQLPGGKILVNIMEEHVEGLLESVLAQYDVCKCDICRADIVGFALNHLPPRYVVRTSGAVLTRFTLGREQEQADIITSIVRAIEVVSKSPKH